MKSIMKNHAGRISPILFPVLVVFLALVLLIPAAIPVAAADLTITTTSLNEGTFNASYSQTLVASGGTPPYTWGIASGALPTWASLNTSTGVISGTPDSVATTNFTVQVTDSTTAVTTQYLTIIVNKATTSLTVADVSVEDGGTATLTATLSPALSGKTISFSINGTSKGTATTNSSGVATKSSVSISGIAVGTHTDYIQASFTADANYAGSSGIGDLTVTEGLTISTVAMRPGFVSMSYSQTLEALGGSGSYTWSKSGTLPTGLTLNSSTGKISGTASRAGEYPFTLTVTDSASATTSQSLTISVSAAGYLSDWGDNTYGQLGNNSTTYSNIPVQTTQLDSNDIIAAATGGMHSLAINDNGDVYAWGYNNNGQLGDNSTTTYKEPDQANDIGDAVAVAAGYVHSLALDKDGYVYSWGDNAYGQLGIGSTSDKKTPTQVGDLSDIVAISAGYYHSLALMSDGTVWAWGYNNKGQLGNNSLTTEDSPVQVLGGEQGGTYLTDIVAISAGDYFNLALDIDGNVWAWGDNTNGQLGNGTITTSKTPTQVNIIDSVVAIAAGNQHSLAIDGTGDAYAWGDNAYGQLGIGSITDKYSPEQVNDISNITSIAAGYYHSLAIDASGDVYAWGYNNKGQLGIGSTTTYKSPEQVDSFDGSAILIAANGSNSMAISSDQITSTSVSITTTSLADGTVGDSYSQTLTATGGSGNYTWSKYSGTLPTGLTLTASTGRISGTPTKSGDYTFTIKAIDSNDSTLYDTQSFTVTIGSSSTSISITTTSLPDGQVNKAYSGTLAATGGSGTYTWSKYSGTLPPGLSLTSTTGKISGTPTTAGDFTFIIKVIDSDDTSLTDTASLSSTIAPENTASTVSIGGMTADTPLKINQDGYTQNTSKITTADGQVTLAIPTGIRILDNAGNPLTTFSANKIAEPPTIPTGNALLSAYTFGPSGANFSSPITLTFKFNNADLPAGVQASSLSVYYYDGTQWSVVTSTLDATAGTVSAKITHFSIYALMGKTTATATASTTPTQTSTSSSTPTTTTPAGNEQTGKKVNWGLLIGVTLGVILLVVILFVLIRSRSSRTH